MTISEEQLMAYADGELGPLERARVEAALRDDPQLQQRLAEHRALRANLERAYAPDLEEPVPERLLASIRQPNRPATATVVELEAARAPGSGTRLANAARSRPWQFMSMAASVVVAIGAGFLAWRHADSGLIQDQRGTLVARGALAEALSSQLAGDRLPTSSVAVGMSFVAKSGDYCRTFTLSAGASSAGLACRHAERWEIRLWTPRGAADSPSEDYRTASSPLPSAILSAVEQQIQGEPLDRSAEIAARQQGWQAVRR
jgi:hypothetical protein